MKLHKFRLAVILSNTYVEDLGRSRTLPALLVLSRQLGTQVKKKEMGGAYYTCCGEERCTGFRCRNLKERDHLGKPDIEGKIILKCNLNTRGLAGSGQILSSSG